MSHAVSSHSRAVRTSDSSLSEVDFAPAPPYRVTEHVSERPRDVHQEVGQSIIFRREIGRHLELCIDSITRPRLILKLPREMISCLSHYEAFHTDLKFDNRAFAHKLAPHFPDFKKPKMLESMASAANSLRKESVSRDIPQQNLAYLPRSVSQLLKHLGGEEDALLGSHIVISVIDPVTHFEFISLPTQSELVQKTREETERIIFKFERQCQSRGYGRDMNRRIEEARMFLERLEWADKASSCGMPLEHIGNQLCVTSSTVKAWLAGRLPNCVVNLDSDQQRARRSPVEFNVDRCAKVEWAYFLGVFCAMRAHGQHKPRIEFMNENKEIIQKLYTTLERLFAGGIVPHMRELEISGQQYHACHVTSAALTTEFNRCTNHGTDIPLEYLRTNEAKLAFLRGFFAVRGTVTHSGVAAARTDGARFMIGLAVLLDEFGVTPSLQFNGDAHIHISDGLGINRFHELEIITQEPGRTQVGELAARKRYRASVSAEKYYAVKKYRDEHPHALEREIAQATGVKVTTFRSWLRDGVQPNEVQRKEYLMMLKADLEARLPLPAKN